MKEIATIAKEALASKTGLPGIVTLLDLMLIDGKNKNSTIHAASAASTHVFCKLFERKEFSKKTVNAMTDSEKKVAAWLREHLDICTSRLTDLLASNEPSLQTFAVDCLLKIVREETINLMSSQKSDTEWVFENTVFSKLVNALCSKSKANDKKDSRGVAIISHVVELLSTWDDLKLYFMRNLGKLAKSQPDSVDVSIAFEILSQLHSEKELTGNNWVTETTASKISSKKRKRSGKSHVKASSEDDSSNEEDEAATENILPPQSKTAHRKAFTDCWLAYLKIEMSMEVYKKILLVMHKTIIPRMTQPTLLIDFLTESYNAGGAVSLLALNGLFTLINQHNLDYPDFYQKLYTLLDENLLNVKYRSRFFRLLDLFLSSAYLPAYLVAAFVKRLSRLSLVASPSAVVIVIPFIYNLMKRHPAIITMIHQTEPSESEGDLFDMSENDPAKCHALESSLWELHSLHMHYLPSVSSLAGIFQEPLTKPFYDIEDFLDLAYSSLFDLEAKKELPEDVPMAPVMKKSENSGSMDFFVDVVAM
ncbi:Nucleolar complex protein 4 [Chytriomyces hyalinus]|nr:Nucleolar complex protein 4 [Chytriomyces hyalinus]